MDVLQDIPTPACLICPPLSQSWPMHISACPSREPAHRQRSMLKPPGEVLGFIPYLLAHASPSGERLSSSWTSALAAMNSAATACGPAGPEVVAQSWCTAISTPTNLGTAWCR